jgi:ATP-dependent Clp protease ATP-binding subunit ClpC
MAKSLVKRLKDQDIDLELTDAALEKIAEEGYDPQYGARPIRRALQKNVEDRLSEELLKGTISKNSKVVFDYVDGAFVVREKDTVESA